MFRGSTLAFALLAAALLTGASAAQDAPASAGARIETLAVAGFSCAPETDARDTWMSTALEEMLAGRMRRAGGLQIIPTLHLYRASAQLRGANGELAPWQRTIEMVGAARCLTGIVDGHPDGLRVQLELRDAAGKVLAQGTAGPGKLFQVLDEATRWALGALGRSRLDADVEERVFAPPCRSTTALEYYAKALTAARKDDIREAWYFVGQSLEADSSLREAQIALAQMETRVNPAAQALAGARLQRLREAARESGDSVSEMESQLAHGELLQMHGDFDAAEGCYAAALELAKAADDLFGRLAALTSLCDVQLMRLAPVPPGATEEERREFVTKTTAAALERQQRVLELLERAGDVISIAPAANKLAMIYEKLERPQDALRMHQRTVEAATRTGVRRLEASAWMYLSQWHARQKEWPAAVDAGKKSIALADDSVRTAGHVTLAEVYEAMDKPAEALAEYEQAFKLLESTDDLLNQMRCLRGIAQLRHKLGRVAEARSALQQAIDIAHVLDRPTLKAELEAQLAGWK